MTMRRQAYVERIRTCAHVCVHVCASECGRRGSKKCVWNKVGKGAIRTFEFRSPLLYMLITTAVTSVLFTSVSWCAVVVPDLIQLYIVKRDILDKDPPLLELLSLHDRQGLRGKRAFMILHPGRETASEPPVFIGRHLVVLAGKPEPELML